MEVDVSRPELWDVEESGVDDAMNRLLVTCSDIDVCGIPVEEWVWIEVSVVTSAVSDTIVESVDGLFEVVTVVVG